MNLDTQLFERASLLEDAHAQESTVLDRVVADLQAQEVLIADRHFGIVSFLLDVAAAGGSFGIRQHARLKGERVGERQAIGRGDTGMVYEQGLRLHDGDGRNRTVRRITVELDTPTRDGDPALHLLTHLPRARVRADRVAQLYRERWDIAYGFDVVTMTLTCELRSLGHPRAAWFLFCMALSADNARQGLDAALRTAPAAAEVEALSELAVARPIVQPMAGLVTALPESEWDRQVEGTLAGRAAFLRRVSRHVPVRAYRQSVRGPKRPRPPRSPYEACRHVSTYRLLQARKKDV